MNLKTDESNLRKIYNLIQTNLNGSWILFVFRIFLGYRTSLSLFNPAEDSQGYKRSSYLDRNSGFHLLQGQIFLNSLTLRLIFLVILVELFQKNKIINSLWIHVADGGVIVNSQKNRFTGNSKRRKGIH